MVMTNDNSKSEKGKIRLFANDVANKWHEAWS